MTKLVLLSIFVNLALTSCALWAAITARSSLRALRKKLAERSTRSLARLDAELTELAAAFASLSATVKRIGSRTSMQQLREQRKLEKVELPTNPTERKAALKKALANGQLAVLSDRPNKPTG